MHICSKLFLDRKFNIHTLCYKTNFFITRPFAYIRDTIKSVCIFLITMSFTTIYKFFRCTISKFSTSRYSNTFLTIHKCNNQKKGRMNQILVFSSHIFQNSKTSDIYSPNYLIINRYF